MRRLLRLFVPLGILATLVLPSSALATHADDPRSSNVVPLGESLRPGGFLVSPSDANSDIAFWRNYAIQGAYSGFRIVDISNPAAPTQVSFTQCGRDQGDVTVSEDGRILVRSQDSARVLPGNDINQACNAGTAGTATTGWEGLQIFDISDKANPRFVKAVYTDCGSHTHTQFQDNANNRLIIYVSRGSCSMTGPNPYGGQPIGPGTAAGGLITAVEVPLDNPAGARVVNRAIPAGNNGCHDVSVFEEIRDMWGACRPNMIHWDITDPVNPTILHEMTIPFSEPAGPTNNNQARNLTGWHTAQFSWNGEILLGGWEPGGGSDAECEAADHPIKKSVFFWSADTGALLGMWTLPRGQGPTENCTIHNLTAIPFPDRHVFVHGGYQSGTNWVDFTNPGAAFEFAWSDPPPLTPTQLGGEWSTYWYNDVAWGSDIPTGLRGYRLTEPWWPAAFNMTRFNPQTNETLFRCSARVTTTPTRMRAGQRATVTVRVTQTAAPASGQPVALQRVRLRGPGISATVRTNMTGVARVTGVSASRAGTLRASIARQINMAGCSATKRVLRAAVVGAPAGGRLTGSR